VFAGLIPDGFEVLEKDGFGGYGVNPLIVVEPVNREALAAHSDVSLRNVASKARKSVVGA
jgi:hypothetical protein